MEEAALVFARDSNKEAQAAYIPTMLEARNSPLLAMFVEKELRVLLSRPDLSVTELAFSFWACLATGICIGIEMEKQP